MGQAFQATNRAYSARLPEASGRSVDASHLKEWLERVLLNLMASNVTVRSSNHSRITLSGDGGGGSAMIRRSAGDLTSSEDQPAMLSQGAPAGVTGAAWGRRWRAGALVPPTIAGGDQVGADLPARKKPPDDLHPLRGVRCGRLTSSHIRHAVVPNRPSAGRPTARLGGLS